MQEEHRASSRSGTSADGARLVAGPASGVASNDDAAAGMQSEDGAPLSQWEDNEEESEKDLESEEDGQAVGFSSAGQDSGPALKEVVGPRTAGSTCVVPGPSTFRKPGFLIRSLNKPYFRWLVNTRG